jgi:hypothetical protein
VPSKEGTHPFIIHRKFLDKSTADALTFHALWEDYRKAPYWLGNFEFRIFKLGRDSIPLVVGLVAKQLATGLAPEQQFNTYFLQRYHKGQFVRSHRDPKNNLGQTIIAPFGSWEGAESTVARRRFSLNPGDVLVQRCNSGGMHRPLHKVSPVTKGVRYALILNTIREWKMSKENTAFLGASALVLSLILGGPGVFTQAQIAYAIMVIVVSAVLYCTFIFEKKEE